MPATTPALPWDLLSFRIRRKVLKLFGASFHVYDGERVVAFCDQKAFKLREDIRLYHDETKSKELMLIRARQVIDFAACYDIVDAASQQKVGALRRKGLASILRDSWEVLDNDDQPLGKCQEDSAAMAMLRRFVNLIPQTFRLQAPKGGAVVFKQRFNPFVYSLEVTIPADVGVDRRLVFATAVLLAAIEGRQQS
jgi:uncharacterized protein YxjI